MTDPATIVHVIDDDSLFRTAIARVLRASGYSVVVYESAVDFLQQAPSDIAGCILLDLQMSDLDGLDLQDQLVRSGSIVPIIFLTGHGDLPTSVKAVKGGAEDFLSKPVSKETLLEAVERAMALYRRRHTELGLQNEQRTMFLKLSRREREVFALMVRGQLNKQIAFTLGTSERTVKAHRHAVMEKLKARSVADAVLIAVRLGFLSGRD